MKEQTSLPQFELRQEIHDLTVKKRATGLSPPEEEFLLRYEGKELILPEQSDDCPGLIIYHELEIENDRKSNNACRRY